MHENIILNQQKCIQSPPQKINIIINNIHKNIENKYFFI